MIDKLVVMLQTQTSVKYSDVTREDIKRDITVNKEELDGAQTVLLGNARDTKMCPL